MVPKESKSGTFPGIQYPRAPGHEVAGVIEAVGDGVSGWKPGDRVGVGWHGGHCGYCESCRRGECAGVTTFNSLRHTGTPPGRLVAVLGLGGLGHLGVQFAVKMGYETVGIARGSDKEPLARRLGAHHYIDSRAQDVAAELTRLGGAAVVLATVTNADAMTAAIGGLGVDGKLVVLGAPPEPLSIPPAALIMRRSSVAGWPSGSAIDSQDTLEFAALTGVRPMNELLPLERAAEGYDRMMSGNARFRVVLAA